MPPHIAYSTGTSAGEPFPRSQQQQEQPHRRRHHRHHYHHRMPTFGKHRGSVASSPLHSALTRFATAHGLRRAFTVESGMSPAGLQPVAPCVTVHLRRLWDELLAEDNRRRLKSQQQQQQKEEAEVQEEKGEATGASGVEMAKGEKERRKDEAGDSKLLSRAGLEAFLRDVQKDPKPPSCAFSHAEGFTFEEFIQLWWNEYSPAKKPIFPEDKDLDKPISNYFISSSHNTYIEDGNQITGEAKALQYKKVLESGCRCVEIDVWNGTEADEASDRVSPQRIRSAGSIQKKKNKKGSKNASQQHWSFSSMLSWMKTETDSVKRRMSFPRSVRSKKSEASFRARLPQRARAISDLVADSESRRASLLAREPRVCHAYESRAGDVTLHEAIPFRTVCSTIRESAFARGNDLPVIISLEVHANGPQQEKMVQIMREEWGSLLLDEPIPGYDPLKTQPPLRELRRKILIKVKTGSVAALPSDAGLDSKSTLVPSEPSTTASECASSSSQAGTLKLKSKRTTGSSIWGASTSASSASASARRKHTTVDALRRLAIYTYSPGAFTNFARADSTAPAHIYSFGEERLKSLHRTEHNEVFRHNRGFLARTFPESLSSFLSSNPNYPTLFWRKGVQMVALNWQVWDTAMEINDAMFDREQGWVLKPPGYRSIDSDSGAAGGRGAADADCQADVAGKKRMDLTITVLAGQHLPTPGAEDELGGTARLRFSDAQASDFRPRVTCFLHVESAAERDPKRNISKDEISQRTRPAKTEQPNWGPSGDKLKFSTVRHVVEGLSFVRFHVEHIGRSWPERTAWACIRLDRLQEGYRLIKLNTDDGYSSDGVLLVKIEKKLVDEPPRGPSLKVRTWNVCKDGASQLKSRWSCF